MINRISSGFIRLAKERGIDIYDTVQNSYFSNLVAYLIDSKYRNVVLVKDWIKEQVDNPSEKLKKTAGLILTQSEPDEQMIMILKWVNFNITYTGDTKQYEKDEYWATAEETIKSGKGDCEDMHILMYVLARLKGISANRLYLWAGGVQVSPTASTGGHCCLFYKPTYYPFNFVYLDACYYPSVKPISQRYLLNLRGKEIEEYTLQDNEIWSNYKYTWFLFNEDKSYSKIAMKQ